MESRILIMRFSAMGDVAMTLPVIYSLAACYPQSQITVLTRKAFVPLFVHPPQNLNVKGVDLALYKGIVGINKLYDELKLGAFTHVADLHGVIRTSVLSVRFALAGVKVATIDKGRLQKMQLTKKRNKVLKPLKSSFERYRQVFSDLGFDVKLDFTSVFEGDETLNLPKALGGLKKSEASKWIGIAPFAKHQGKVYPLTEIEKLIEYYTNKKNCTLFIFGGQQDTIQVSKWTHQYPQAVSMIGVGTLEDEMNVMAQLDVIFTMDSANMHIASLAGTRVVSFWGATHHYAGFLGWNQKHDDIIAADIACRPCSVFGDVKCYRGDYKCLHEIKSESIIQKMDKLIFG